MNFMNTKFILLGISVGSACAGLAMMQPFSQAATPENTGIVTQVLNKQKQYKLCSDSFQLETAKQFSKAYKVDNQTYFVIVQCFLAAYQGNYEFLLYTPGANANPVKPLTVTEFIENQPGKAEQVMSSSIGGLPTYDPNQQILTIRTKYRGAGDCGSIARYRLQNAALNLMDFKAKFVCDGKTTPYQQLFPPK